MYLTAKSLGIAILTLLLSVTTAAETNIEIHPVRGGIHMITGEGGNIGLFIGEDGTFMIDDQFAPLSEAIKEVIVATGGELPRFILNTHFHGDHTGGNENFAQAGSAIVAHHNVRQRMSVEQVNELMGFTSPAAPDGALPIITFEDNVRFHWNGDTLQLRHMPHAHTDGDVVIQFVDNNVIHTGDLVFAGSFPFIDTSAGGTIGGVIAAAREVLEMADDDTIIIPGHGDLMDRQALAAYLEMLEISAQRIGALKAEGKSLSQIQASQPMADYQEAWGGAFINADTWVKIVYQSP